MTRRDGVQLLELLLAVALGAVAIAALGTVLGGGVRFTYRTVDQTDSVRSALLLMGQIRFDTSRMIVQNPNDYAILDAGHALRLLVPGPATHTDLWNFQGRAVTWRMVSASDAPGVFQLERTGTDGARRVKGSWLKDFVVRYRKPGELARGAFLDITITALAGPAATNPVMVSFLCPIRKATP